MAHRNSNAVYVYVDNTVGTITNLSGDVNSLTFDGGQNLLDDTGMSDTRHTVIKGLANASNVSLNGWLDSTTEAIWGPVIDGTSITKTVAISFDSSSSWWTGEVWPESVTLSAGIDELQTWSAELRAQNGLSSTSVKPS